MKIGIMGGTFNPIHNAHLMIAQLAAEEYGLDSIWFMTSGNPPHKADAQMPDAALRQEMVRLAIDGNDKFCLCNYEVGREQYSYTAETLRHFCEVYPEHQFYFIIGADSLRQFHRWYCPHVIAQLCTLLVFPRSGNDAAGDAQRVRREFSARVHFIHAPMFDISSSLLRGYAAAGKSIRYLVPDSVRGYIDKHGLYRAEQG